MNTYSEVKVTNGQDAVSVAAYNIKDAQSENEALRAENKRLRAENNRLRNSIQNVLDAWNPVRMLEILQEALK